MNKKSFYIIDSREQENKFLLEYFEKQGIPYEVRKLEVGDYFNIYNPNVVVDRKFGISEICSNLCSKDHQRVKREIERAMETNTFIYFVIQDEYIYNVLGVKYWKSSRNYYHKAYTKVKGETLMKVMLTMQDRYPIRFVFAKKDEIGKKIVEILTTPSPMGKVEKVDRSKMILRKDDRYLYFENTPKEKKITGTIIASLCGENPYNKKGDIVLERLGIIDNPPINPFYTKRGEIAEKIVRDIFKQKGYETQTWVDKEIDFDNFKEDKVFGGLKDLEVRKGNENLIIEIKSKNVRDYEKVKELGVRYQETQLELYEYLDQKDGAICWCFFDDYAEECIRDGMDFDVNKHCKFILKHFPLKTIESDIENLMYISSSYYDKCKSEKRIPLSDISANKLSIVDEIIEKQEQERG